MKKTIVNICVIIISTLASFNVMSQTTGALTLKGKLVNAYTFEPIIGATIQLVNLKSQTTSKLDGSYNFNKLKAGSYTLRFSNVGYTSRDTTITIQSNSLVQAHSSHICRLTD